MKPPSTYAIGNLLDEIDNADPCSRNRQITSMQRFEARARADYTLRVLLGSTLTLAAITTLIAIFGA